MSDREKANTLTQFIMEQEGSHRIDHEFSMLMSQIGLVAKVIGKEVGRAGLTGILGMTGAVNVQGEQVQKLDQFANEAFVRVFEGSGLVGILASEEMEKPMLLGGAGTIGKYALLCDPLDGSSNISVNASLGTIFSIYEIRDPGRPDPSRDILRKGVEQIAAGYVIFGPSTMLVYCSGKGTHGFTLDPYLGEFVLSHPEIRIPQRGKTYSINHGNYHDWMPQTRKYVDHLVQVDSESGRPYSLRYIGTLVADLHRTLLDGGIFIYPAGGKHPQGKLRLLYEAAPMAFVVEAAGGKATQGVDRILDLEPSELHQRVPLFIGSPEEVDQASEFLRQTDR